MTSFESIKQVMSLRPPGEDAPTFPAGQANSEQSAMNGCMATHGEQSATARKPETKHERVRAAHKEQP